MSCLDNCTAVPSGGRTPFPPLLCRFWCFLLCCSSASTCGGLCCQQKRLSVGRPRQSDICVDLSVRFPVRRKRPSAGVVSRVAALFKSLAGHADRPRNELELACRFPLDFFLSVVLLRGATPRPLLSESVTPGVAAQSFAALKRAPYRFGPLSGPLRLAAAQQLAWLLAPVVAVDSSAVVRGRRCPDDLEHAPVSAGDPFEPLPSFFSGRATRSDEQLPMGKNPRSVRLSFFSSLVSLRPRLQLVGGLGVGRRWFVLLPTRNCYSRAK
jgi:hypothetical protein